MINLNTNLEKELKIIIQEYLKAEKENVRVEEIIKTLQDNAFQIEDLVNVEAKERNKILNKIPNEINGIYFICNNSSNDIEFIEPDENKEDSKGKIIQWFKINENTNELRKPNGFSNLEEKLKEVQNSKIIYIGKAESEKDKSKGRLRKRIKEYMRFGNMNDTNANNHAGGRAIWQIKNIYQNSDYIILWLKIDNATEAEKSFIDIYKKHNNGFRPLANEKDGG